MIVAARDAAATIGTAVRSALASSRVAEVLVVDDASADGTAEAARRAASGDARLRVLRLARNGGPAAARNRAIAETRAPLIAVLDADDAFAPDRFRHLPAEGWDLWADDVAFRADPAALERAPAPPPAAPQPLDLAAFVNGNVSRPGRVRGELGFLKPLIRRDFLVRHGLLYDESLRLGEDYVLYARALAAGARFVVQPSPGYVALLRATSLSAVHRTQDLLALVRADAALLALARTARERRALRRHARSVRARHAHRECLDIRRGSGRAAALAHLLVRPRAVVPVLRGVVGDKLLAPPAAPDTLFAQVPRLARASRAGAAT